MIRTFEINILTIEELSRERDSFIEQLERKKNQVETWIFSKTNKTFWKLAFEFTHRCGSSDTSHYPIFNNPKSWLWISHRRGNVQHCTCSVCDERVKVTIGSPNKSYQYFKKGREEDAKELHRMYSTATNNEERNAIKKSLRRINNEQGNGSLRSAREALVKATRAGNIDEIKDIQQDMEGKDRYKNE